MLGWKGPHGDFSREDTSTLTLRRLSLNLQFLNGSTVLKANLHLLHLWWAQRDFSLYAEHSCIRDKRHRGSKKQVKRLEWRILAGGKETYYPMLEALTKLPNSRFTFKLHSATTCRTVICRDLQVAACSVQFFHLSVHLLLHDRSLRLLVSGPGESPEQKDEPSRRAYTFFLMCLEQSLKQHSLIFLCVHRRGEGGGECLGTT